MVIVAAAAGLLLAACGDDSQGPQPTATVAATTPFVEATPPIVVTPVPGQANLLRNAGLEEGLEGWFSLSPEAPEISDVAHSGAASARLRLREPAEAEGSGTRSLGQDTSGAGSFPEVLSGYYRVEGWKPGASKQYLEAVAVVFGAGNLSLGFPNVQMHYVLAGIDEQPGEVQNARFVFLSREQPEQDEWVYFEANISEDFQELWGAVPEGYSRLRLLFRIVYEEKVAGAAAEADVYFDDFYLGSAGANPNQPP